jgi:hypothetical protein
VGRSSEVFFNARPSFTNLVEQWQSLKTLSHGMLWSRFLSGSSMSTYNGTVGNLQL